MGQTRTAVELTEKGLRMHINLGLPYLRSGLHLNCGGAYFMLGDLDQARAQAELALQFALQNKDFRQLGRAIFQEFLPARGNPRNNPGDLSFAESR